MNSKRLIVRLLLLALPIILFSAVRISRQRGLDTALLKALSHENYDKAETLIARGANAQVKNANGVTALSLIAKGKAAGLLGAATANQYEQTERWINKGANVNASSGEGDSILMCVIRYNCRDIVPLLERAGARKTDEEELVVASYMGRLIAVQKLLSKGVKVDAKDIDGDSALSYAAAEGHISIIKALIAAGANVNSRSKYGETPLKWAIKNEHKEAAAVLKQVGGKAT